MMQDVLQTIERIALSDLSVVIVGEHGTGKEWAARLVHSMSRRANGVFYPVDCAALSSENAEKDLFGYEAISWSGIEIRPGAFEEASGGTLLLDEIHTLPRRVQMKIARTIEYQTIYRLGSDVGIPLKARVIATLSRTDEGKSRNSDIEAELHERFGPVVIELPPLRERREDIPLLIETFLDHLRTDRKIPIHGISTEAMQLCLKYDWPGNIRHLKNAIEYASVMSGNQEIQPEHFPSYLSLQKRKASPLFVTRRKD